MERKKQNKETMNKPLLVELKAILSHILNSDNKSLRRRSLEFAMELLSMVEMDFTKAEKALQAEIRGKRKEADSWIEKILTDIDKEEYSDHSHP
ncbi:hypothetical protein HZB00_03710 [Candidatus Woesearchaeota archaeon]|nr:hypothetical protein [Candidatus Woesearchaeota archaeon]